MSHNSHLKACAVADIDGGLIWLHLIPVSEQTIGQALAPLYCLLSWHAGREKRRMRRCCATRPAGHPYLLLAPRLYVAGRGGDVRAGAAPHGTSHLAALQTGDQQANAQPGPTDGALH
eukprot:1156215-Pelagomonas_calceolata.AAC.9